MAQFPDYEVKNRVKLEYPLDEYITRLDRRICLIDFRPTLLRGRNEDCLFPGLTKAPRAKSPSAVRSPNCILKLTGLTHNRSSVPARCWRHHSPERPGDYELVRQLLGHRSVKTTIKCYIGLKKIQASQIYRKIVRERLKIELG